MARARAGGPGVYASPVVVCMACEAGVVLPTPAGHALGLAVFGEEVSAIQFSRHVFHGQDARRV